VKYLIIANVGVFLFELLFRPNWLTLLALSPANFWRGCIWQPVTYMFLHGGIFHLLFNMFVLWMFGIALESTWGPRRFLAFYFICGIGAGLLNAAITPGSPVRTVGSSGAIYGLLMAFGMLFPNQLIYVWGIFPVRAKYFVIGIGFIEFLAAASAERSGIAHLTHLGGMLFGLVYMKWGDLRKFVSRRRHEKRRIRHLKVVWDREREKERLQKEIDEILDKIRREGIDSLTAEEHERMRKATERIEELEGNNP
jgi:membrane associated rhomboid family serine protease